MKKNIYFLFFLGFCLKGNAQLRIESTGVFIQSGTTVTVQGDVTSNVDIQGTGLLLLKGSSLQNVDMGGYTIPNLELDNTANVSLLNTDTRIGTNFMFTNGKFQTANLNLILSPAATITGGNTSRFIQINGTGKLVKELTADIASFELPVGENTNYRPGYLTTSGCAYGGGANFGIRVLGTADANIPPMIASYLKTNWPVTKTGITGGTVSLSGQYIDPTDVLGTEANLVGYYSDGIDWSSIGETHNATTNLVGAPVTAASGVVSGFNKFLAVGSRAFLQGAYVPVSGLMADNLRTLPFGSSSSTANFPSTDPYRVAPYNAFFTHVNNVGLETIPNSGVVGAQVNPDDNVVDWVFLELRNLTASPGNVILQTRSALVQKDGDIVDIDGVSPVTFNNLADGNYIISVRHRNHLGLSLDQSLPRNFTEKKSIAFTVTHVADLRVATDPELFGTASAFTTASHPTLTTINLLWGGNAYGNNVIRYSALNNDRDYLFSTLGNNPSSFLSNIYHSADVNMNRTVRYSALNNDRDFIFTVLGNNPSAFIIQVLPN